MYLLFDIGGTKIRLGKSSDKKTVEDSRIIPTPKEFNDGIAAIKEACLELAKDSKIEALAGGVAGQFDKERTKLLRGHNLMGWVDQPLKSSLTSALESPVFLENDAALGGLGEAIFGAGKDKKIVAYLTISTGVGGARVVNGEIDANSLGMEPGKQVVGDSDDQLIILEDLISGAALEKRFGKKAELIDDQGVWDQVTKDLSIGVNNTLVYWSPDIVILGGSVVNSIDLDKVRGYTQKLNKIFPALPPIERASLGDEAGLFGALAYLKQKTL